jgi:tRNA-specific 2-thiouridylase
MSLEARENPAGSVCAAEVCGSTPEAPEGGLTAVAMSGGLDSSVAAWLLAREGVPVVGLSMLLWDEMERPGRATAGRSSGAGRCCGALDLGDARRVARQAGIPHYTLRMDEEFRERVVDPFVADYLHGRTPIPCVGCNTRVKFDLLLNKARSFGAGRVATGHYACIVEGPDGLELHRAVDGSKDQSYFLFELNQEQLAASLFPLGELTKTRVRELAREAGLVVAEKGESMEICFVAGGIRDFVESQVEQRPERFDDGSSPSSSPLKVLHEPAEVVTPAGEVLGHGEPYYRYTVGQRRGLGISAPQRLYVLEVQPDANRVVVGGEEELLARGLTGERLHWIAPEPPVATGGEIEATVKIRARHPGVPCRVKTLPGDRAEIEFTRPQRGVTPGQAAVLFEGSRVLGGCWIDGALG